MLYNYKNYYIVTKITNLQEKIFLEIRFFEWSKNDDLSVKCGFDYSCTEVELEKYDAFIIKSKIIEKLENYIEYYKKGCLNYFWSEDKFLKSKRDYTKYKDLLDFSENLKQKELLLF